MLVALAILLTLGETPFGSTVDQALNFAQSRDWMGATRALDRAWLDNPAAFEANNLHYLRGRIAENQQDWIRALEEFERIGRRNPLHDLATWHAAYAAIELGADERAEQLVDELPKNFPADMKIQLVGDASPFLALKIVENMKTREGRFQRALLRADTPALWALVRERNSDDVALESARILVRLASSSPEWRDLGEVFAAHRDFEAATAAYRRLAEDSAYAAEARYELARIRFLREDYSGAIEAYRAVAEDFPGSDWAKDADYQVGNSYWRLRQYNDAEAAYLRYIDRYKSKGTPESAIRDLADIYRSLGENTKAIALIDRTLSGRVSTATRQVLLFTRAKILYGQGKYSAALRVLRQFKGVRLRATPNGTTAGELLYFEALCLEKIGKHSEARSAWRKLAADPDSYYGQRAAEKLGQAKPLTSGVNECSNDLDATMENTLNHLAERRRPYIEEGGAAGSTDVLTELMFLQLWDEASLWIDNSRNPDAELAAELAYASGRYNRSIVFADRIDDSNPGAEVLLYPAGYRSMICRAAGMYGLDPLWLHAIIWQESKYNPEAHSGAAARGLMQFIPDTAEAIATDAGIRNFTIGRLYDPETSIRLGAYYWSTLLSEFKTPELALAAYNAGPDNVRRWRDKWPASDGEFFVSDIGFTETKLYVQAVYSARAVYGRTN